MSSQGQSSSDDDHFSDASEGDAVHIASAPSRRIERVDSRPSHGEVPGTDAYNTRLQDAVPDQIEVIPRVQQSRSSSTNAGRSSGSSTPIPETVVEKVNRHEQKDSQLDEASKALENSRMNIEDSPTPAPHRSPARQPISLDSDENDRKTETDGDAIGDDFDEFEEGGSDEDFGAFDDEPRPRETPVANPAVPSPLYEISSPLIDFDGLDSSDDVVEACEPYLDAIFPNLKAYDPTSNQLPEVGSSFLNERSQSLWAQLIAPPPLSPPNWVRSRIRRLFLVSLGVPVDLDEILPASKQKKLILPSIEIDGDRSTTQIAEARPNPITRVKSYNASSTSVNSSGSKAERRRKGPPRPPELDVNAARRLCSTTDTVLQNYTNSELSRHVSELEMLKQKASELLEYWLVRKDSAVGDKDAFEEVIENLVKHAKKIRK